MSCNQLQHQNMSMRVEFMNKLAEVYRIKLKNKIHFWNVMQHMKSGDFKGGFKKKIMYKNFFLQEALKRHLIYQNRPFQMWAWSCITSYPLQGLPYLAYDNVNPTMVNSDDVTQLHARFWKGLLIKTFKFYNNWKIALVYFEIWAIKVGIGVKNDSSVNFYIFFT